MNLRTLFKDAGFYTAVAFAVVLVAAIIKLLLVGGSLHFVLP